MPFRVNRTHDVPMRNGYHIILGSMVLLAGVVQWYRHTFQVPRPRNQPGATNPYNADRVSGNMEFEEMWVLHKSCRLAEEHHRIWETWCQRTSEWNGLQCTVVLYHYRSALLTLHVNCIRPAFKECCLCFRTFPSPTPRMLTTRSRRVITLRAQGNEFATIRA